MKSRLKVVGLTAIFLTIGLVGWYSMQRWSATDEYAHLNPRGVCNGEFGGEELDSLERALPRGKKIDIRVERNPHGKDLREFWSRCSIIVDGTIALKIESELTGSSKAQWRDEMRLDGVAMDGLQELNIGDSGFTTPFSAAIYVSCENLIFDHKPVRLTTTAVIPQESHARSGEHREALAEIALYAAHSGNLNSQCEPSAPLPPHPLEIY